MLDNCTSCHVHVPDARHITNNNAKLNYCLLLSSAMANVRSVGVVT